MGDSIPFVVGQTHFSGHHWSYIWIWARHGASYSNFQLREGIGLETGGQTYAGAPQISASPKHLPMTTPISIVPQFGVLQNATLQWRGLPFGSNGKSTIYRQLFLIFHVQESFQRFPIAMFDCQRGNLAWPNSK